MRRHILNVQTSAICIAGFSVMHGVAIAAPVAADHVTVELISETTSVQPGSRAALGLKFVHEPHWHTYWINPGDSGLPTQLNWQLPSGYRALAVAWPAPHRFDIGGLYNFGYDATVLLPVSIEIPATAQPNTVAHLAVNAKWLICNDQCISGRAALGIDLPIASATPTRTPTTSALFASARAARPKSKSWQGQAQVIGDKVRIELRGTDLPTIEGLDAFPVAGKLLNNAPLQISRAGDRLAIEAEKSDYFEAAPKSMDLVLVQKAANRSERLAWHVTIPWLNDSPPASARTKSSSR